MASLVNYDSILEYMSILIDPLCTAFLDNMSYLNFVSFLEWIEQANKKQQIRGSFEPNEILSALIAGNIELPTRYFG